MEEQIKEIKDYAKAIFDEKRSDHFGFAMDVSEFCDKLLSEPTIKVSELKSFIEEQKQYLCECVNSGDLMREDVDLPFQVLNKVLREFCKGESRE
jgi:hypothetical protein